MRFVLICTDFCFFLLLFFLVLSFATFTTVLIPNTLANTGQADYLFYYMQTYLGYKTYDNAWQIAWWGLTGIFVSFVFLPPMLRRCGERSLLIVGIGSSLASFIFYFATRNH